ncbi:trichohyalin isoform X2 [Lucilia cuprina]|uniref:trichohyalin isoform X2 n=1 Tax=Lucilia cuprina TaxID=7375 RepID=UPI001F054358|nr:trichohyalin isoform X2 [Lucilia cuprina]
MGELFAEFGDLVFTLVIGYISAIEFLYVVRHLYHYSFNHDDQGYADDGENLSQLQDSMRQQLINAKNREALAGTQVMKDGVPYKDGFRLEAQQSLIEQLKEQLKDKELSDLRRQELEKELAKQMKIAEQLRKELAEAEAKYERQLKQEEEEKAKKLKEEQQKREKEEQAKKEAEEQARKLQEAEKQREAEQRKRDEEERVRKEAEQQEKEKREREEQARREAEEQALKLMEAERQREAEQRQREEAENARKLIEAEQQREAEENARRIAEAEKQKEIEQQQREEAEENERKLLEAEQRKHDEAEAEENARRLVEIERANEEKQAAEEAETEAKKLLEIEHRLEEQLRAAEREAELTEKERQLIESIKQRELPQEEGNEQKEAELLRKILEAREQLGEESEEEQSLRLIQRERDQEAKQKRIEENALLFLEAEKEMAELQAKMLDAVEKKEFTTSLDSAPQTPAVEEPCIKRTVSPLMGEETVHHTVKTQLAQDLDEPYSVSSKTLLFPGVSDDASSIDPASSLQSSFSTQPSEEITTGTDSQYPQQERQEPDGEDTALSNLQYSDDYLRSLDGIKQRPLVREDGSGRRRAFKKRRSSNSSNSSRESRHSRDEELKMFTSLEEEEMKDTADSEFTPIRYTSEPTLKVKGHHRRHKRSPAKDMRHGDDSLRSSLERLGEETSDPWGEVKPEHYKHTEFWKREKTLSIDEETEFEKPASSEEVAYDTATNMPSASSFEEATQMQNEEALTALQRHSANWEGKESESDKKPTAKDETTRSDNTNLIFSGEYTKAMDKDWHSGHFCCWQCDESLTGQRYVIRDDHPYCIKCYENVFANTCEECNKIIGIDSKDLSYKDKHWHEACFLCFKCHLSLVDKQFGAKADKIYCGNCYDAQFASRCDGCGEVFRAGTKKMEYKTRQWHENCFCCCVCKTAIGTKSFIPREQEIYCAGCYEEKFATRCIKCNKVITSGGVTYKNEPWHRECFTCTHCNITLAGQRFTSRDEKPYCADCFGELFAKRCTSCVKPITGIGGTRFISFEDRHWHHDCFVCASCKTSLVGRGFITDGPDIICPECAKQKLM